MKVWGIIKFNLGCLILLSLVFQFINGKHSVKGLDAASLGALSALIMMVWLSLWLIKSGWKGMMKKKSSKT
jgi:threonine/homoserine/homoserine lactone efflux protein